MPTSEQLLDRMNDATTTLEEAIKLIVEGKASIAAAPQQAAEAKMIAQTATTTADAAKAIAQDALPKTGGKLTGDLSLIGDSRAINFQALNDAILGRMLFQKKADGGVSMTFGPRVLKDDGSTLFGDMYVNVYPDGSREYLIGTPDASKYNNQIDTLMASIGRHLVKPAAVQYVHIGGSGASDTADLNAGRGMTAAMPFASIDAAAKWAPTYFSPGTSQIYFYLHADLALPTKIDCGALKIDIRSATSARRTLTLNADFSASSNMTFSNIDLDCGGFGINAYKCELAFYMVNFTGTNLSFLANTPTSVISMTGNSTFSGQANTYGLMRTTSGGAIHLAGQMTGSITGKRYSSTNGGRIYTNGRGANIIPGTETGSCDANSVYA